MNKFVFILLMSFIANCCIGQEIDTPVNEVKYFLGFGVGPETALAGIMPKVSIFQINNKNHFEYFYGGEFTPWIGFSMILSLDAAAGLQRGPFTVESSIGVLRYFDIGSYGGPFTHGTLNPKIGLNLGLYWFKVGPSFYVFQEYAGTPPPVLDLIRINNQSMNLQLIIQIK